MSAPARARRRIGRRLPVALAGLGVLVLVASWALHGVRQGSLRRAAFPQVLGELTVSGLEASITIDRDARGIAHVEAAGARDGWFGLGFVHAQDRLGQMLWLRLLALGRSAEIAGPATVESDRLARLVDFRGLAEAQLPKLRPDARRALEAYAAGINARMERVRTGAVGTPLAIERAEIPLEPWDAADSLAVLKVFAWGLGQSLDASLLLRDLIQELGAEAARPFFPGGRVTGPPPAPRRTAEAQKERIVRDPLRRALGLRGRSVGSSAWVVGGAHTESGHPILVADSHLATTAPPYLHLDRMRAGGLDVAGATLPGVPIFWTGRNRHVAWAAVHAPAVVTDLYIETLDPSDPRRYHDGRRWRTLRERVETIHVRGADDVTFHARSTRHGPLLPESFGEQALSLAWVGARTDGASGVVSLLDLAAATDAAEVVAALKQHHEPAVLVVYADAEGGAGLQMAGWIPSRSLSAQLLPLPGRASWYDWRRPVPYRLLPSAQLEEGRGWIVAADAKLDVAESEHVVDWLWRTGLRAQRIRRLIRTAVEKQPAELRGLMELQVDERDERALELVKSALALVDDESPLSAEARELADMLRAWDGRVGADSIGASAYHVFSTALTEQLLRSLLGQDLMRRYLELSQADPERLVHDLVARAGGSHSDRQRAAWDRVRDAVRESLREGWLRLSFDLGANRRRWTWGRLHPLRFRPFGGLAAALDSDAGIGRIPYGGNASTVNAASFDPARPYDVRVASTLRFAVDTASLDQGLVAIAPGQSEHPGHPHFADGVEDWLAGRGGLLASGRLLVEESSVARLVLQPVR